MHRQPTDNNSTFQWEPQPQGAAIVQQLLGDLLARNAAATRLAERMRDQTGTRLIDWLDHVALPRDAALAAQLTAAGYCADQHDGCDNWRHPAGLFPAIVLEEAGLARLAIRVDSVADFMTANQVDDRTQIIGAPLSAVRRARVARDGDTELWVVERHGSDAWEPPPLDAAVVQSLLAHAESFRRRRRDFDDDAEGFEHLENLIRAAAADLGRDRTCDLFFASERDYWQSRNRAARVQKARQDALGLGWGNHDHHTYRSSRDCFAQLIAVFEQLGCHCRERFYAGGEAGWGAQVLEQPACRIVIFADVDMTPDEVSGDFSHGGLSPRAGLGTVGLWCRLHGEAILQAGMHHLECQFDFGAARDQLLAEGIGTMPPFTDFAYLKQAFTEGEIWPVAERRLAGAVREGLITDQQAESFRQNGVLGSHLEILQRDDGYKGFNQTGVSDIIRRTDPRRS